MGQMNDLHVNTHDFPLRHDPDLDAPYRQPVALLSPHARCETCAYWCGLCGLDTTLVTGEEWRCRAWEQHPRHREEVARVMAKFEEQSKYMRAR